MKLINNELPIFMNVNISPVFQILGDDRWVSRSYFTVNISHSPTPLSKNKHHLHYLHSRHIFHTLRQIFDGFGSQHFFTLKNQITKHTSQSAGLVINMMNCEKQPIHSMADTSTREVAGGLTTALNLEKPLVNGLCGQSVQTVLILKITPHYILVYSTYYHCRFSLR
jgi:hypothetical protein